MPNKVTLTPHFENRYKRFAKKISSLESEIDSLVEKLLENATFGKSMGSGLPKIRLASKSKEKARVAASG